MTLEYRCSNCGTLLQTTNADAVDAEIERLRATSINLLAAMDDMHEKGETFTARVSIAAAAMRRALEQTPQAFVEAKAERDAGWPREFE